MSSIRFMIGWQSKIVVLEIERSFDVEIKILIKPDPEIFIRFEYFILSFMVIRDSIVHLRISIEIKG